MTATLVPVPSTSPAGARRSTERPALSVVQPASRRPAGLVGAVAVLLVFGALLANAMAHSVLVSGQSNLDSLNQQVSQQQTENQHLRLVVARLESPERIVTAATDAGMVVPTETHWVMRDAQGVAVSSTSARVSTTPTGSESDNAPDERATGADQTVPTTVPQGR